MKDFVVIVICLCFVQLVSAQVHHWETAVYAGDNWRYLEGSNDIPSTWIDSGFDDSNWNVGPGSIGYGDEDDNVIIDPVVSLFMRREFQVDDKTKFLKCTFHADYDDGFVAYLNGVEIARSNLEGNPPEYYSHAPEGHEAILYQGGFPQAFTLGESLLNEALKNGTNTLSIQTHNFDGTASSDLTTNYWISFGISDETVFYGDTPNWFVTIADFQSNLPILQVNTNGQEIPDEPSVQAEIGIVWNGNGVMNSSTGTPNEFLGKARIERRGQSSLFLFPKNGFFFETQDENGEDLDVSFLNFPEEEDWVLHGPYSDKTLMRNVLTMHLARGMGQYASRTRFVELMINDEYQGVYVLMEKIKRDKNRIDIANLKEEDISGDQLTGGYVFKVDKGDVDWFSEFGHLTDPNDKIRFQYVAPKRNMIVPEQKEYIRKFVDSFERSLVFIDNGFAGKKYTEYCNRESFVEFFILNEFVKDVDAYRLSTYLHKDKDSKGGKLTVGPMWDFNLSLGNSEFCNVANPTGLIHDEQCGRIPTWWQSMLKDEGFKNALNCRWNELRQGAFHKDSIMDFINTNEILLTIGGAAQRNFEKWPTLDIYVWPNAVVTGSYAGEINFMQDYIEDRLEWLDSYFGNCNPTSVSNLSPVNLTLNPNPVLDLLQVNLENEYLESVKLEIISSLGISVKTIQSKSHSDIKIDVSDLQTGVYYLKLSPASSSQIKNNQKEIIPFVKI